jgi:hypothetical protein
MALLSLRRPERLPAQPNLPHSSCRHTTMCAQAMCSRSGCTAPWQRQQSKGPSIFQSFFSRTGSAHARCDRLRWSWRSCTGHPTVSGIQNSDGLVIDLDRNRISAADWDALDVMPPYSNRVRTIQRRGSLGLTATSAQHLRCGRRRKPQDMAGWCC